MMQKEFRSFFLCVLGYIALVIAPLTLLISHIVYGLPFPDSISQTATMAGGTLDILPYCMGALAVFSFAYAKTSAHDITDAVCTYIMAAGFTLVAAQPCSSAYLPEGEVGIFKLSHEASGTIHSIGAVMGFGAMIVWIMFCFSKSDKPADLQTEEKKLRNDIYFLLGFLMISSLGVFIISHFIKIPHIVFFVEALMLIPGGLACIVKSGKCGGHWLADKK
jgi:hypothetical protein